MRRERYAYRALFNTHDPRRQGDSGIEVVVVNRNTNTPSVLGCIYAAHLCRSGKKIATIKSDLQSAIALLTWSDEAEEHLPLQLAHSKPLELYQIRKLTAWLRSRSQISDHSASPAQASTYNATIGGIRRFIDFMFLESGSHCNESTIAALDLSKRRWKRFSAIKVGVDGYADDLEDEQIAAIEGCLAANLSSGSSNDRRTAMRDYLMWRLAIEYGIRISEMLALRIEDLPSREANYLKIVRTEHRPNYFDPRGSNAPSVKTAGRELGYYFSNTRFPLLFNQYLLDHRWAWSRKKSGLRFKRTHFKHDFVLTSIKDGAPLSLQAAQTRAADISYKTGIDFNWHACRHSFFNRAYAAMEKIENREERAERKKALVYWGGWTAETSLDIYTRTARRNKARTAAFALSSGNLPLWSSLDSELLPSNSS